MGNSKALTLCKAGSYIYKYFRKIPLAAMWQKITLTDMDSEADAGFFFFFSDAGFESQLHYSLVA